MLAIWNAQEIDLALKKAYDKGIVIAGGMLVLYVGSMQALLTQDTKT